MYHPLLYQGKSVSVRNIGDLLETVLDTPAGKTWLDLRPDSKNEKTARELEMQYRTEGPCDVLCTVLPKGKSDWLIGSVFPELNRGWTQLRSGGHLIIIMSDLAEVTNMYIETFLDPASWEGVITVKLTKKKSWPAWIWTKSETKTRWNPTIPRSLASLHPVISGGIFRSHVAGLSPLYTKRVALIEELAGANPELGDVIRKNKIMVTTMVEEYGIETTLRFLNGA